VTNIPFNPHLPLGPSPLAEPPFSPSQEFDKSVCKLGPDQQRAARQKWARDQQREQARYKLRCGLRPPPDYPAQWQYTCVAVGWWSQCVFQKTFLGSPVVSAIHVTVQLLLLRRILPIPMFWRKVLHQ
jgi:hypothetical protein